MDARRQQLRQLYGFDFPDEFFAFWELIQPLDTSGDNSSLWSRLGLSPVGPFDVLAGKFDGVQPAYSQFLHERYFLDLPEFFTIFWGDMDGLHFGYWLDDPALGPSCVTSYYNRDGYCLTLNGDTLFEAVRARLEHVSVETLENIEDDPEYADEYRADLEWYDLFRSRLMEIATANRPETGEEYTDRYQAGHRRAVVAPTYEGIGIVVPPNLYRPPSLPDETMWKQMRSDEDTKPIIAEAHEALNAGFPGTTLKIGQDLWILGGEQYTAIACDLLSNAYAALNRPLLQQIVQVHAQNRNLMSVDILRQ